MRIRKKNSLIHNTGFNKIVDPENSTFMSFLIPAPDQTLKLVKVKKIESKNNTGNSLEDYAKVLLSACLRSLFL
jgi:hypothetical protein